MNILILQAVKNKNEAREIAIEWQSWTSNRDLSYKELLEWQTEFENLANKFNLKTEFKENGII